MSEILDLYDIHRNFTHERIERQEKTPKDRYRLAVRVWVRDDAGRFLLSQRHPNKIKPLLWESTGGAVDSGEDTLTAAIREVREELGLEFEKHQLELVRTQLCGEEFADTYLANWNGKIEDLRFQEGEVVDARWATYEEMENMDAQGLLACDYRELFDKVRSTPTALCPMRIEDYDSMMDMWREIPGMGLNNLDDSIEGIGRFLARNPNTCFVIKSACGLVGTILCGHDGRRGMLYHAAVSEKMQGKGLGYALVEAALEALREEGISKVGLHVFAANEIGNRFWDRLEFADRSDVRYRSLALKPMQSVRT